MSCSRPPPLNLVIVTFDTTRADAIGCYGNPDSSTPAIDDLAAHGTRFTQSHSAVPITLPSHTTLMTGTYPPAHGVRDNGMFVVSQDQLTLAEILASHGYRTGAAVASFPLASQFGLDQGFEMYDDHFTVALEDFRGRRSAVKQQLYFDERKADLVNEAVWPWLDAHASEPFFLWVHYFDPHQPHNPPPPYNQLFAADSYLGEIAAADEALGALVQRLKDSGAWDHTVVVMTADHGEGRGQHGEQTHSTLNYETTLHVPLVVRVPHAPEGIVVNRPVGLVDVVPTVLDLLGIEVPDRVQGRSLATLVDGSDPTDFPDVPLYAETLSPRLSHGLGELRTIIEGNLKYIYGPRPELFDLSSDPDENDDLAGVRPDTARRLRTRLEGLLHQIAIADKTGAVAVDDETRQRLAALGYLQTGGTSDGDIREVLRDDGTPPQDRVGDVNDVTAAKNFLLLGDGLQARAITDKLLSESPDNVFYLQMKANAEIQLGQIDRALKILEHIRDLDPRGLPTDQVMIQVAATLFQRHEIDRAIRLLEDQQSVTPSAQGQWALASLYGAEERGEEEIAALEGALTLDAEFSPARVDLAAAFDRRGDVERARQLFVEALERHPYYPKAHYNYAVFLIQQQALAEARDHLRRAIALDPGYLRARYALIVTEASLGNLDSARAELARLEALAPASQEAARARHDLGEPS